jgi:galactosyl transferase GMA12/MNN10 family
MSVDLSSYVITRTTHPVWGKLPAILEAMKKYPDAEWVWWLDIDAIIMTPTIELHRHLLDPDILQTKLVEHDPILLTSEQARTYDSGLLTTVSPQCARAN